MLIELQTSRGGRWYWVTYPMANGGTATRLVVTRMDPNNIAVEHVACTVYGVCDYLRSSWFVAGDAYSDYRWVARKVGFGRSHSNIVSFHELTDAKVWLLTTVAHRLRRAQRPTTQYLSPFSPDYTYEAIGCL